MITRLRNRGHSAAFTVDRPVPTSGDAFVAFPLKNQPADSLISTYRDSVRNFKASFCLKSFPSICRRVRYDANATG